MRFGRLEMTQNDTANPSEERTLIPQLEGDHACRTNLLWLNPLSLGVNFSPSLYHSYNHSATVHAASTSYPGDCLFDSIT
jgi:hypothetical protein